MCDIIIMFEAYVNLGFCFNIENEIGQVISSITLSESFLKKVKEHACFKKVNHELIILRIF